MKANMTSCEAMTRLNASAGAVFGSDEIGVLTSQPRTSIESCHACATYAVAMRRDVTETLAVDATDLNCSMVDNAVKAIQDGKRTVVADDATAVAVLERLGLSRSRAIDRLRFSYGPMRDPADECLQHLPALMPTAWFQYRHVDGTIKVVGRWFWPNATRVEGNFGSGWVERRWLLEVQEDTGWEATTEDATNAWLAAKQEKAESELSDSPSVPSGVVVGIPEDWTDLSDEAKEAAVQAMLTEIGRALGLNPGPDVDDNRDG